MRRSLAACLLALSACSSGAAPPSPDGTALPPDSRMTPRPEAQPAPDRSAPDSAPRPGPWKVTVVDDSPKFKSRVAITLDAGGKPHLVYNVASSDDGWSKPDLWHATPSGSSWERTRIVPAEGVSNEFPSVADDGKGKLHVVYNRFLAAENQIDLFTVSSDDGKTFSAPANLTASKDLDEFGATITVDGQGTLHVLAQRGTAKPFSIGYLSVSGGKPSAQETVASDTAEWSLNPGHGLAVDASGTVHAVYSKPSTNPLFATLYLKRRKAGAWGDELAVTDPSKDAWDPCVAVDGKGVLHVAYVIGLNWDAKTLTYKRYQEGTMLGESSLTSSIDDRSYYLGMALGGGLPHLAYSRYLPGPSANVHNGDIFYIGGTPAGSFNPEERLTETKEGDEGTPAIAVSSTGVVYVAFTENMSAAPNGKIYLATH